MRLLRVLCCALAITAFAAPYGHADEWNKQTYLTFSAPVQVPGATLPAGTYTFKLADLQGNRHVVQVFDKEGTKLYTTILAIPDERLEPTDKPVVMFSETAANTPAAIKAWFYPGDRIGDEFVYPRSEAVQIAKATHQSVLSRSDESSDMKTAEVGRVDESGTMNANEQAKANEQNPSSTTTAGAATTTGTTMASEESKPAPTTGNEPNRAVGTTGTTAQQPAPQAEPAEQNSQNPPNTQNP